MPEWKFVPFALLLCAAALSVGGSARSESLLIYEPVVHEVLGNLVQQQTRFQFIDCNGDAHDPAGKEVKETQDTCDAKGIIIGMRVDWERYAGTPVVTRAGETVGRLDRIIVNASGDRLNAVVEAGGFLGIGSRDVALSYEELRFDEKSNALVTPRAREDIEKLPEVAPGM